MNNFRLLLSLYLISFSFFLLAQNDSVAISQWRSHLSYSSTKSITENKEAVFFASTEAILKVYKEDQSLEHLNKVIGLHDMGVKTIEYYQEEDVLIIAYDNGNIDLLYNNGLVSNLSAIKTNSNIIGSKEIFHIYCNDQKIYFSCAFGLVVYDMNLEAFTETVFTQTQVSAATQLNDTLFIATEKGIYTGVLDGRNLQDFALWDKQTRIANYTKTNYHSKNIIYFNNQLYADYNDTLIYYKNGRWQHLTGTLDGQVITSWISTSGNPDFVANYNMSLNYNKDKIIIATQTPAYYTLAANNTIISHFHPSAWQVKDIVIDQDNITWAADKGYMHRNFQQFRPNAPISNTISDLHVDKEGTLWATASPYNTYRSYFDKSGFFRYKNGIWKMYNHKTYPQLDSMYDCVRITSNPLKNKIYVGSYMRGLIELDENENITVYDQYTPNCSLTHAIGDNDNTRVIGLAVDEDGHTWMANSLTNSPLAVLKRNGDWKNISITKLAEQKTEYLAIDRNGFIWIKQITGKVVVYDPGVIDDDTDDRSIQLGDNNTVLSTNTIHCLEADKNGIIWLGTDQGITIFNCAASVFDGECQGNRPVIALDNFNGHLLEGENVKDIAVDGANRKWVGTSNGLFLLSADGSEQLLYFNTDNSPLFDNEIQHIAIDGISGTVYIATGKGLQSFRSDATTGLRRMKKENILVFPHPIAPDYMGPIAIKNLADDANVKITDISGRLVYQTIALGGQAIWNGKDYNGRKAQSGVYLVFITNEDGGQKAVAKILFMN